MQLWSITVICLFCVVRFGSCRKIIFPFKDLPKSTLFSRQCRDLQDYPFIKLVGGECVDQNTSKYGILRAEKQCHYNVNGVTPSTVGYSCCEPIVCCPSSDLPTTIREQYCHAVQDFAFQERITLYREALMPVKLNPNVCGEIKIRNAINDDFAKPNEFPFMAELGTKFDRKNNVWNFSGVLISNQYILTPAYALNEVTVARLGTYNNTEDVNTVYVNIIEQIPHPTYFYDIGLMKLERVIEFNAYIRPACLPTRSDFLDSSLIVSWSIRNYRSRAIKTSTFTIPNFNTCRNQLFKYLPDLGIDNLTQVCLETDTCLQSGMAVNYNNRLHETLDIIGIYSFELSSNCNLQIFARVAPYVDWIESIVWK